MGIRSVTHRWAQPGYGYTIRDPPVGTAGPWVPHIAHRPLNGIVTCSYQRHRDVLLSMSSRRAPPNGIETCSSKRHRDVLLQTASRRAPPNGIETCSSKRHRDRRMDQHSYRERLIEGDSLRSCNRVNDFTRLYELQEIIGMYRYRN